MDDDDTHDDLDSFLKKVNDIESVVKAMQSSDANEVEKAFEKSEKLLKDVKPSGGFNRTSINTNPSTVEPPAMPALKSNEPNGAMRQDEFMRICEEDARQRAESRKKRLAAASNYKEAGNAAFKLGNYEAALAEYTRAIEEMRDYEVGYTNRALTLIELRRFDDALADCNFALRIDERNTKAMFVRAKTLAASGQLDEARQQYEAAALVDPKLTKLVHQRLAELGSIRDTKDSSDQGVTAVNTGNKPVMKAEELVDLLVSLNICSRDELGEPFAFELLVQDFFSKRIAQLLVEASPARNRCDLELQQNAARKVQRAVDAMALVTKLATVQRDSVVCSEVLRATHYCASRWVDVYIASSSRASAIQVITNELQSSSACVIEHALAYLANCTLLADNVTRLSASDLESNVHSFIEVYLIRLVGSILLASDSEADKEEASNRVDLVWPVSFQLLVDRALIVAARAFRFLQPDGDAQQVKFVTQLMDAIVRILDVFIFHFVSKSESGSGQPLFATVDGLALSKHALFCLVSAVRHVERDVNALSKLFTSFSQSNLVRFRMLCNELISCSDCVTVGNIALLFQSFARTKQLFRRCLVEVLLRNDATGLKRLLAILADDFKLDVAADWQVCTWSAPLSDSAAESDVQNSKRKQTEQTKANIAILLGKLTQPPPDAASSQSKSTTKSESAQERNGTSDRETGVIDDELSVRLTECYRRLHAFEILHGTMHLIK